MARLRAGASPLLVLTASLVALVSLIPLLFVILYSISIGWDEAWKLIVRQRVAELLGNTVKLVAGASVLTATVGVAAAWLVERTNLPARRLWNVLMVAPLAIPAFVNGFAWVSLTARVEGLAGAILVVTLSYFPFVYLPVAAALRGLDPALEETAHSLGYSQLQTFRRVVIPQLLPALVGGVLLVSLHLLAEFGALQMLRFPTFTTGIYDQYRSSFNGPAANMLAGVLAVLCLLLLTAEIRVRGNRRYARLGGGTRRQTSSNRLGRWTVPALVFMALVFTGAIGVPVASLVHWFVVGASSSFPVAELLSAMATSIGLGVAAALAATLATLPVVWLTVRHRAVYSTFLERSVYFSNAFPGIVVALALITAAIRYAPSIYQTTALLVTAYLIMFLPRAIVSTRAALLQAAPVLDDVARSLGASKLDAFRRVTWPIIAPGVGAGAALVFLAATTELTATLLLAPIGTHTLATQFWSNSSSLAYGAAAPYAMLLVLISMPATYLLTRETRSSELT